MGEETKIGWCDAIDASCIAGSSGPSPSPPRSGDKKQARQRINVLVRTGKIPHPNSLPCSSCGHIHDKANERHEYHHYLGYSAENHYKVISLCTKCHADADSEKANKTHCIRGHEFTEENTYTARNGTRHCIECRRMYEQKRRPRDKEYWRKVNEKRRKRNGK